MFRAVIIEDEELFLNMIRDYILSSLPNFTVSATFSNASHALEYLLEHGADVVISDIRMPQLTGLEMMRMLREHGITVPFIIISGFADFEYAQQALQYGALNYLLKPIDFDELTRTLVKVESILEQDARSKRQNDERIALFLTYVLAGIYLSPRDIHHMAQLVRFPFDTDDAAYRMLTISLGTQADDEEDLDKVLQQLDSLIA